MNKDFIKLTLSIIIGLLYAFLFAGYGNGLNTALFSLIIIGISWWQFPEARNRTEVSVLFASVLLSAVFYIWHHSTIAILTHHLTVLLLIGVLQAESVRFLFFSFLLGLSSLVEVPKTGMLFLRNSIPAQTVLRSISSWMPFVILPVIISIIFGGIYYSANPNFAHAVDFVIPAINWVWIIENGAFWNLLIGFGIGIALLGTSHWLPLTARLEAKMPDLLVRKRRENSAVHFNLLSLKREYWAAVATLIALNILLFSANLADLRFVWLDYGHASPQELSQYVHSGTSLLILAVLLAIGVLLWYFRANLNFYPDKGLLKLMAYIWLAQNALLLISVGLRNWQYVQHYGLAYKRLGVYWFLLLVAFGLLSMFIKLKQQKTIYYLLKQNTWALFTTLLLVSSISWDNAITRYNLQANTPDIDTYFLFSTLSDKNIGLLWERRDQLAQKSSMSELQVQNLLINKRQRFLDRIHNTSWRGWNIIDAKNYKTLKKLDAL